MNFVIAITYLILGGLIAFLILIQIRAMKKEGLKLDSAILNPEDLVKHAAELARNHAVYRKPRKVYRLLPRLNDNFAVITHVYRKLNSDVETLYNIAPAAEWLLDNYYIIEEQVKDIRHCLAKCGHSRLPVLRSGVMKGYPRIYAIAIELVSHTDARLDEERIIGFLKAYQSEVTLSMEELWSFAIMLRHALIEELRHLCEKVLKSQMQWHEADRVAKDLLEAAKDLSSERFSHKLMSVDRYRPSFVEHLLQNLRKEGKRAADIVKLIDLKLVEQNSNIEAVISQEHQIQATRQVSMGNCVMGLRFVSTMNWSEMFEELSSVEQILSSDPSGVYKLMDFESRDYYRHTIAKLAKKLRTSETNIARISVICAREAFEKCGETCPETHVGYYLVDRGAEKLKEKLGYGKYKGDGLSGILKRKPSLFYIGSIVILSMAISALFCAAIWNASSQMPVFGLIALFAAALIPASDIAVSITNSVVSHICKPSFFPRLELKERIPGEYTTLVIVPTLLPSAKRVRELLEQLEIYYLANRENNLYFALVGDFRDSDSQHMPDDDEIVRAALNGVEELNRRYSTGENKLFYYFHRHRQYNEKQGRWMGWERKRGAILELNDLIRGSRNTSYSIVSSDPAPLARAKFVITLDADTNLPMDAAKRLIGTLAHPLNRAVVDRESGRVLRGYGILQPRIGISINASNKSLFARIFANQSGIDPYTTAVSDVYQDLFGEGIFTGKGIYDLNVFQDILKDAVPENAVLSHDLLEGCYVRAGLVMDIELIDGYPARYNSYAMRLHRWVRGDWQLLPWLLPRVRNRLGHKVANPLSAISKWKIIDNLRRSLMQPLLLLLVLACAAFLPDRWAIWSIFVLVTAFLPLISFVVNSIITGSYACGRQKNGGSGIGTTKALFYQCLLQFAFIPYQAWLMADAIARTVARVCVTKRNLLEWVTAADMELQLKNTHGAFWRRMWAGPVAGLLIIVSAACSTNAGLLALSVPFSASWIISPSLAWFISRQRTEKKPVRSESDVRELRLLARKIWRYFEDFAGPRDNYLPVDNFQEDPLKGAAHRTSPTNIGFLLVSMLAARDLGYLSTSALAEKLNNTITTIEKLDKWKGHLYNWYDTITLRVLRPLYVSTVDSGNYLGYLMVLEQGLREYLKKPILDSELALGLIDTIELFNEEIGDAERRIDTLPLKELAAGGEINAVRWREVLTNLRESITSSFTQSEIKSAFWGKRLLESIGMLLDEADRLFLPAKYREINIGHGTGSKEGNAEEPGISALINECLGPGSLISLLNSYEKLINFTREKVEECRSDKPGSPECCEAGDFYAGLLETAQALYENCRNLIRLMEGLARRISVLIENIEFRPLYNEKRQLFAIGYNVEEGHQGKSFYDLLASEARQASYIAVARGEISQKHWFRLGRRLVGIDGQKGLVSWTGTMFEYLMPTLIMRSFENTLLDETYKFVLKNQIKFGKKRNIPWGVSESGFNAFDLNLNYQYKAFGIPELGLKRGLGNDIVVAPYATLLALPWEPEKAVENIRRMKKEGFEGLYGLYEAIDYTPSRLGRGEKYRVVKSFMAHHQGMSLLALDNYFNDNIMQKRFHSNPLIKAAELLLQERVPSRVTYTKEHRDDYIYYRQEVPDDGEVVRMLGIPSERMPEVHVLSNGSYTVVLTDGGAGYSRCNGLDVTRWRPGIKEPEGGIYIYVRNMNSNESWPATYRPGGPEPEVYNVVFSPDRAEYMRKDGNIETHTEVVVSPEDNVEIRRVSLTNRSQKVRVMEITSYMEVVLADHNADAVHPAFSNLFIRTELIAKHDSLIASRRPRSSKQVPVYAFHTVAVEGEVIGDIQYETDRFRFVGRNRDLGEPQAMDVNQPLSGTLGSVLDPVLSLRRIVRLEPGQTARISFTVGVAESRKIALELAEKYHDPASTDRALELSWTRSQVESRYLGFNADDVRLCLKILPHLLFNSPARKKWADMIAANKKGQPGLWAYGISGDLPILLVVIRERSETQLVQRMLKAHEYWKMKGLPVDLVILLEDEGGYTQPLLEAVRDLVSASHARELMDIPGGVFIRNAGVMDDEDRALLYTAARLVLRGDGGPPEEQLETEREVLPVSEEFDPAEFSDEYEDMDPTRHPETQVSKDLRFFNGIGGFDKKGTEYVIELADGQSTPTPWVNVIANRNFGFLISESGAGYTWAENSRENKLTPWSNDPVVDPPGEVIYARDEDRGNLWSITPAPIRQKAKYTVRHGFGYTVFEHTSNGLRQKLTEFVALEHPVKICLVRLKNMGTSKRRISLTWYVRPVMGVLEHENVPFIVTEVSRENGALLFRNVYNSEFPGRVMFIDCSEKERSYTGDRVEFIGLDGSLKNPAALRRKGGLSGRTGAALDPCGAIQTVIELNPSEEKEAVFLLGQGRDAAEAVSLSNMFRKVRAAANELEKVKIFWRKKLQAIQVSTPDESMNFMLNGWLMYQVISCRLWARSAFYQSGGAYGFRDQLQDSLAVTYIWPEHTRRQILLHAAHQFLEGDVQHWWHPEANKGIRTRYSDDLVWLVYVTEDYIRCTGDRSILDATAPWLESDPLPEGVDERYDVPRIAGHESTLYEHCVRALDKALKFGTHGIPLIGSGDWNDGMNTVGNKGKGESIWLGWFIYKVLVDFIPLCRAKGDLERAERYAETAKAIAEAIEAHAWDGSWYRRAYFDDGRPLGSAQNTECRIDSLAQSWSAISGVGRKNRVEEAMNAVEKYLVDRNEGIIKLLAPPFDEGDLEPGYIKGYVPGVRENGGQYTHAAVWVILAFAKMGYGDKAWELYHMINPINHARTPIEYMRYKVEPYVMAADVYAVHPHAGRGGWTWYTGAAGWMYRVGIENILGFTKLGDRVKIDPCIPASWTHYTMVVKHGDTTWHIKVQNPSHVNKGVHKIILDGVEIEGDSFEFRDDGEQHVVEVLMG